MTEWNASRIRREHELCLDLMAGRARATSRVLIACDFLNRLPAGIPGWRYCADDLLDKIRSPLEEVASPFSGTDLPPVLDPLWYSTVIPALERLGELQSPHGAELNRLLEGSRAARCMLAVLARDYQAMCGLLPPDSRPAAESALAADGRRERDSALAEVLRDHDLPDLADLIERAEAVVADWSRPRLGLVTCPLIEIVPLTSGRTATLGTVASLHIATVTNGQSPNRVVWHNAIAAEPHGDRVLIGVANDAVTAAEQWFHQAHPARRLPSGITYVLSFPDKMPFYAGSSVGLSIGVGVAGRIAESAGVATCPVAPRAWAFTGGLSLNGDVLPPAARSFEAKFRALRHSPCQRLFTGSRGMPDLEGTPSSVVGEVSPHDPGLTVTQATDLHAVVRELPSIRAPKPRRRRSALAGAVAGVGVLVLLLLLGNALIHPPPPVQELRCELVDDNYVLQVRDKEEEIVFQRRFRTTVGQPFIDSLPPVADVGLLVSSFGDDAEPGVLWLFDLAPPRFRIPFIAPSSSPVWQISVNPCTEYFPPEVWRPGDFDVRALAVADLDGDGQQEILAGSNQVSQSPSVLYVVSATGELGLRYANYGNMGPKRVGDFDGDGNTDVLIEALSNLPYPEGLLLCVLDLDHWTNKFEASAQTAKWTLFIPLIPELREVFGYPYLHAGPVLFMDMEDGRTGFRFLLELGGKYRGLYVLTTTCDLETISLGPSDQSRIDLSRLAREGRTSIDYSSREFLDEWTSRFQRVPADGPLIQR